MLLFTIFLQNLDSCMLFLVLGSLVSCFIPWTRKECGLVLSFYHGCFSFLQTVGAEVLRMGVNGPWITKSYLELILERKGWDQGLFFIFISPHLYMSLLVYFLSDFSHCSFQFVKLVTGVPRLNTPPLLSSISPTSNQEKVVVAPKPIRITPNLVTRLEDLSQPWTRSPTKSKMEPVLATWHFISPDPLHADSSVTGMGTLLRGYIFSVFSSFAR